MAVFFNQKEEVMSLVLTPYGRHLLSQGKFRPASYVFYDEGILYDGIYGGIIEDQNEIVTRIKTGTPILKPTFPISMSLGEVQSIGLELPKTSEITPANSQFYRPLGKNSPWSDKNPAWNISTLPRSVPLSGGYNYLAQGLIPNLTASVIGLEYSDLDIEQPAQGDSPIEFLSKEDKFCVDVLELNTLFKLQGNYDIEVYRVPNDEDENLVPLSFIDKDSLYYDHLRDQSNDPYSIFSTVRGDDDVQRQFFPMLTPDYVEYYLSIRVDEEIVDAPALTPTNVYTNVQKTPDIVCDDVNIYGVDR